MRRVYVDWARGLAILVMIEAHTFDAWARLADRSTTAYRYLIILGGFAAPAFLWLAGLALVLSAEARLARTGDRHLAARDAIRRGLEIFILAFLFRLQALIVTHGNPLLTLFRVDILNVMGPSLVVVAIVWGLTGSRGRLTPAFAALATTAAMVTPLVRTATWVNALPIWLQWQIRPAGEHTAFTAFPWMGFVFAGYATWPFRQRLRLWQTAVAYVLFCAGMYGALMALDALRERWRASASDANRLIASS